MDKKSDHHKKELFIPSFLKLRNWDSPDFLFLPGLIKITSDIKPTIIEVQKKRNPGPG